MSFPMFMVIWVMLSIALVFFAEEQDKAGACLIALFLPLIFAILLLALIVWLFVFVVRLIIIVFVVLFKSITGLPPRG